MKLSKQQHSISRERKQGKERASNLSIDPGSRREPDVHPDFYEAEGLKDLSYEELKRVRDTFKIQHDYSLIVNAKAIRDPASTLTREASRKLNPDQTQKYVEYQVEKFQGNGPVFTFEKIFEWIQHVLKNTRKGRPRPELGLLKIPAEPGRRSQRQNKKLAQEMKARSQEMKAELEEKRELIQVLENQKSEIISLSARITQPQDLDIHEEFIQLPPMEKFSYEELERLRKAFKIQETHFAKANESALHNPRSVLTLQAKKKIPLEYIENFNMYNGEGELEGTFKSLLEWLERQSEIMKKVEIDYASGIRKNHCPLCQEPHKIENCPWFRDMTPEQRFAVIRQHNCCRVCFSRCHRTNNCKQEEKRCSVENCTGQHHPLIHRGENSKAERTFFEFPKYPTRGDLRCPFCNYDHELTTCRYFQRMPLWKKFNFVRSGPYCSYCLSRDHIWGDCPSKQPCGINGCDKSHHQFLHRRTHPNNPNQRSNPPAMAPASPFDLTFLHISTEPLDWAEEVEREEREQACQAPVASSWYDNLISQLERTAADLVEEGNYRIFPVQSSQNKLNEEQISKQIEEVTPIGEDLERRMKPSLEERNKTPRIRDQSPSTNVVQDRSNERVNRLFYKVTCQATRMTFGIKYYPRKVDLENPEDFIDDKLIEM